ncbi:CvpA family protein [Corallincola platygyrae]|uniref:CvpA family protein n=1 Tax=Corallincola platygyrae TaxID=1193278 RepID=A0ABW4XQI6_9GAMM
MIWIDFLILGVIALSALISLVRGFVKEAMSLVSWIAAFFISSTFYRDLSAILADSIEDALIRDGVSALLLFICTLILGALINYIISQLVQKTGLSGTDRVLGICFGAVRGGLVICAMIFLMTKFFQFADRPWWQASELIPHFEVIIDWFFEHLDETQEIVDQAASAV